MYRLIIAIIDIVHLAANVAFFAIGFSMELHPTAAFIYMPLILLGIWSIFFGIRAYFRARIDAQNNVYSPSSSSKKSISKPLTAVLES